MLRLVSFLRLVSCVRSVWAHLPPTHIYLLHISPRVMSSFRMSFFTILYLFLWFCRNIQRGHVFHIYLSVFRELRIPFTFPLSNSFSFSTTRTSSALSECVSISKGQFIKNLVMKTWGFSNISFLLLLDVVPLLVWCLTFNTSMWWIREAPLARHTTRLLPQQACYTCWGKSYRCLSPSLLRSGNGEKYNNGDTPVVKHSSFSRFNLMYANLFLFYSSYSLLYY